MSETETETDPKGTDLVPGYDYEIDEIPGTAGIQSHPDPKQYVYVAIILVIVSPGLALFALGSAETFADAATGARAPRAARRCCAGHARSGGPAGCAPSARAARRRGPPGRPGGRAG